MASQKTDSSFPIIGRGERDSLDWQDPSTPSKRRDHSNATIGDMIPESLPSPVPLSVIQRRALVDSEEQIEHLLELLDRQSEALALSQKLVSQLHQTTVNLQETSGVHTELLTTLQSKISYYEVVLPEILSQMRLYHLNQQELFLIGSQMANYSKYGTWGQNYYPTPPFHNSTTFAAVPATIQAPFVPLDVVGSGLGSQTSREKKSEKKKKDRHSFESV